MKNIKNTNETNNPFKIKKLIIFLTIVVLITACDVKETHVPYWLTDYSETYKGNPNEAARQWFQEAKFGMFVHLNLASLLERGKLDYLTWMSGEAADRSIKFVGYTRQQYEAAQTQQERTDLLFRKYSLEKFDAEKICDLAVAAEMKYINFTTTHLGGCFNFDSKLNELNSVNAPVGRDLVGELAKACKKRGLALFLYVTPGYSQTLDEKQTQHNLAYLTELLTQYGPVAGIWFDGPLTCLRNPEDYKDTEKTYELIRKLQPHALISFKDGSIMGEDFISPENYLPPFEWEFGTSDRQEMYEKRAHNWSQAHESGETRYMSKLREINTTMLLYRGRDGAAYDEFRGGWINDEKAEHLTGQGVYDWLKYTRHCGANMLMNIGPRADGSIHPDDYKALTEVGKLIRKDGWPKLDNPVAE